MGRWTYYSPLLLGAFLVIAMNDALRKLMPAWTVQLQWLVVIGIAILVGLHTQVLMVGAQGAFAQVLPVPGGRSIRGGSAMLSGWLLIAWCGLSAVTVLLGYEAISTAAQILGFLSLAALAGALGVYFWALPTAVADFREQRPSERA